jgi:hypothetical protein
VKCLDRGEHTKNGRTSHYRRGFKSQGNASALYPAIAIVAVATALLGVVRMDCPIIRTRSSSGTVIVLAIETDKIILAADSRGMTDRGGHTDDDCKLLIFGKNIIFASTGEAHLEVTAPYKAVWDARAAARRSIARLSQKKDTQARDVANALASSWAKAAVDFFQSVMNYGGKDDFVSLSIHADQIVEGIFAVRGINGSLIVSHVLISLDPMKSIPTIISTSTLLQAPPEHWSVLGYSTVAANYIPQPKNELALLRFHKWQNSVVSKSLDEQKILYAAQVAQWTIDSGFSEVGGVVDEAVLDNNGTRWVRRKSNCQEDSREGGYDTLY